MQKNLSDSLKAILWQYRLRFIKAFFMVLASNLLLILNPLVFRHAVTALDPHAPSANGFFANILKILLGHHFSSLYPWIIILLIITFVSAYFKYWMRIAFISISRDVETDVRAKLFARIQEQSRSFFDRHGIGELLSRLTNDITSYRELLGPGIMYPLFFITLVFPGLAALSQISLPLTLISLIPLILIPVLNAFVRQRIYRLSLAVQEGLGKLSKMAQEHFSGIRIVKSYVIENYLFHRFCDLCSHFATLSYKLTSLQGILYPFFTFLTKCVTVLLVLFSGLIILLGWGTLSIADFVAFMWIQSYIFFPVLMLGWVLPVYERGRAAYVRIVEIYEEPLEVQDNANSRLQVSTKASIEFRNLTFCYPNSPQPTLNKLSLRIEGGSFVGITGPVGAGKTTLFRLLNREYEIPRGSLLINNQEIQEYSFAALFREIVTVEQSSFLFSKSVADNVRFGREEATLQELELVSTYADLHETVMEFPKQYETMIGERGMTLSGGQKQRVAMARAFLVDRSILLLDDIFSAVDAATEKRIFSKIREHFAGKTVVLITHRVSLLEKMDRVIYLLHGQVAEEGPPADLVARKGHYAALVELQHLEKKF